MNELLKPGQVVQTTISGQSCQVERCLGGGGQGEVYLANWAGRQFALKWYFPHTATREQRLALENLVKKHNPPSDRFLWPLDLAESRNVTGFGYIMRLRETRFRSLFDLVTRRIDPTFAALTKAALGLVDSFRKLHAEGLCYRDISFGNAFFDPHTGEVLICDNDNVTENRSQVTGVLGTPDFMAPELVLGKSLPSRETDLFSLAVLLFYFFCNSHPLVGKRILSIRSWDLPARNKIFGQQPLFIFDPTDASNEAVDRGQDPMGEAGDNALQSWPIYPQFFRDTVTKAFTAGLRDPEYGRVTEGEWLAVLSRLRDSVMASCPCRAENFFDPVQIGADGKYQKPCWKCGKIPPLPFRLEIGKLMVMLNSDTRIVEHHLDEHADLSNEQPVAEVSRHPANPNTWGLKNVGTGHWVATTAEGVNREVAPGKSIVLAGGTQITLGKVTGVVRY